MSELVSICVPTYNGEKYLKECLDSLLAQSYTNIEIIIVDDGSRDGTVQLVKAYEQKDQRLKLFVNEKNLGLVGNWNRCIEHSKGEWIKFVFQDDYLEYNCVQQFIEHAKKDTSLLVSKRSFILDKDATLLDKKYYETGVRTLENTAALVLGNIVSPVTISKVAAENIALNFIGEPSLTMFRKNVIDRIGYFNDDLAQICDLEFFLRLASETGLVYITEKICHFRIHGSSTTSGNLQEKTYILSYLEPIILVKKMLYDIQYASFRSSLTPGLIWKLKTFFKVRSYEARINSLQVHANKTAFEQTALKFTEIKENSKGNMFVRLKYLLILIRRQLRKLKP